MEKPAHRPIPVSTETPIWSRFFTVAPLVIVGTREGDGHDLAPKHMAMPLGWDNYFCFVCSPQHATQSNAQRTGQFTVSFPHPDQVVEASLAAAPREEGGSKPSLDAIPTFPASTVDGVLVRDAYLWLECELDRVIDGFGRNTLIVGRVVAAAVDERALRDADRDDADLIREEPLLAYLSPGRLARVSESFSFPYHVDFKL
ncbi:MAG TPA: flavin reductase [Solirubrobacterales bacterium]|jgi:flavin reductase (DIM6/NTAB) family NADH-FMN oxidoreductase RutF|nr:flavin reductase [Solirubrobacterales bacterium]